MDVLEGGLEAQAPVLFARVFEALSIPGSPLLAIETLSFLARFFTTHPSRVYQSSLPQLVNHVVVHSKDKSQKVSAEAFTVCSELAKSLRSSSDASLPDGLMPIVQQIYTASETTLRGNLADFEVRVKALETLTDILCHEGDALGSSFEAALDLVKTSVGKESLRSEAIKATGRIARCGLCSGDIFEGWLRDMLEIISGLVRRGSRTVKVESFKTLQAIANRSVLSPFDMFACWSV